MRLELDLSVTSLFIRDRYFIAGAIRGKRRDVFGHLPRNLWNSSAFNWKLANDRKKCLGKLVLLCIQKKLKRIIGERVTLAKMDADHYIKHGCLLVYVPVRLILPSFISVLNLFLPYKNLITEIQFPPPQRKRIISTVCQMYLYKMGF